jgi:hypothetical protein
LRRNAATRSGGLEYRATTAQWHADVAKAIDYMLKRWPAVTRFLDDGRAFACRTTPPSALCAASQCGVHCTPLPQVSGNIRSWFASMLRHG